MTWASVPPAAGVWKTPPGTGALVLSRPVAGLIVRDDFNRPDSDDLGNNWTEVNAGGPSDISIINNTVRFAGVGGVGQFAHRPAGEVGAQQDVIVQANVSLTTEGVIGAGVHARSGDGGGRYVWQINLATTPTNQWEISRLGVLVCTLPDASLTSSQPRGVRGVIEGPTLRLFGTPGLLNLQDLSADLVLRCTFVDGNPEQTFSRTGFLRAGNGVIAVTVDEFFVCGRNLVVRGLPAGWKVQVDARPVVVESGGSVTIDVDTWALPATTIRALDAQGAEQDALTPAGGIWGGDEYLVAPSSPPGSWEPGTGGAGSWASA